MNLENTPQHILELIEAHPDSDRLPVNRKIQMANSLSNLVIMSIGKYYAGQAKHGGDICDRDLKKEIRQEQIDQFWYTEAQYWKRAAIEDKEPLVFNDR